MLSADDSSTVTHSIHSADGIGAGDDGTARAVTCPRCHGDCDVAGLARALPTDDPLAVVECPDCGAVVGIVPRG